MMITKSTNQSICLIEYAKKNWTVYSSVRMYEDRIKVVQETIFFLRHLAKCTNRFNMITQCTKTIFIAWLTLYLYVIYTKQLLYVHILTLFCLFFMYAYRVFINIYNLHVYFSYFLAFIYYI